MDRVKLRLGNNESKIFYSGIKVSEVINELGLDGDFIGARLGKDLVDLQYEIKRDHDIEFIKNNSKEALFYIRHTSAHVMAEAVQKLFPGVKVTIGPVIDNGFYYDFDYKDSFTESDLEKIEEEMNSIIAEKKNLVRENISREDAVRLFSEMGENYKVEIIKDLPENQQITLYKQGKWFDLCRGPHAPNTGFIKAFKLLSVAGAYWRGRETNPMLQRIYGTAYFNNKDLKIYLNKLEEAKKRDHRRLGVDLDLFSIQDDIGPGLVLWHPKGSRIRRIIEDVWRKEHEHYGYDILFTPHIAKLDLWRTSGHLDFYRENMYSSMEVENSEYQIKPMTCPFHIMIYKTRVRSYRDLPLRWAEIGTVYRYERSGVLHGLLRVRGFSQDDAHIFCRPDQIEEEVMKVIDLTLLFLKMFGFDDYEIYLSTKPDKYVGSDDNWEHATDALKNAIEKKGLEYGLDEGGGAFYGPKIDLKINDVLGRSWQCSTVQVDFNLPERFNINYIGHDNSRHVPIMIHRAIFGSFERFFGILIEHYGGAFPLWLSPVQVRIVTISDEQVQYGNEVFSWLKDKNIRVDKDFRNEKLGLKVREAQLEKIPYVLIVGDNEVRDNTVSPRIRGGKKLESMNVEQFLNYIENENNPYTWREVETNSENI